jgi:DNA-binding response OmpR family regulator
MADEIKILISDGDKVFLELCKIHLRKSGVNILTCQNGKDALDIIRNKKPHLAVMAAELPIVNGFDCCRIVKTDETLQTIPVLLTLSSGKWEEVDRCHQAGCDEVILKPINRHIFYLVINRYVSLNKRRAPRFRVRFPVNWTCGDGQRNSGYSVNISTKAIFVESEATANVNSIISINFTLPANDVEINCKALVYCVYHNDIALKSTFPKGLVLEFVELSEENYSYISEYIRKEHIDPLMRRLY